MNRTWVAAAMAGCLGLVGCQSPAPVSSYSGSSGSLALSRDEAYLYAVETDHSAVEVVDLKTRVKIAEIAVGARPERIVVGVDDTLYVSNRGSRSISVIRKGDWVEAARVAVGVEPVGMALTPNGSALLVVNATARDSAEHGTLMAIDTATLAPKWEVAVGEEPRAVAALDDRRALVSLLKQGDVVTVDLEAAATTGSLGAKLYDLTNAARNATTSPGSSFPTTLVSTFHARSVADIAVSADGKRAYATTVWSREDAIVSAPTSGGYYGGGGPCASGAIATPGVVTVDGETGEPKGDDLTKCGGPVVEGSADFPPSVLGISSTFSGGSGSPSSAAGMQGPSAAVVDPSGEWLYIVYRESHNVAVLPTYRRTGPDLNPATNVGATIAAGRLVDVGAAPSGIALSRDGKHAYVHNAFDHTVSVLTSNADRLVEEGGAGARIIVADEALAPEVAAGRRLFFDARDTRMSNATIGISCNTCHNEGGREDGHTWGFPDGLRQTPSLAGRMVTQTAPYHWSGEFPTLAAFMDHTVRMRMGGTGMSKGAAAQMAAYLDSVQLPENANKAETPSPAQVRGAQLFVQADCTRCHAGSTLTNNTFADVGTFVTDGRDPDDVRVISKGLNTPSLIGVARTAPYLHDGSEQTLKSRLMKSRSSNKHGLTASLSEAQIDDLVEYLRTL